MTDNLITLDCEQGTDEWLTARLGIVTGTGFENIVTAGGKKSGSQIKYMAELIEESILGLPEKSFKSADMERGNELEPLARMAYEFETGYSVQQVGGVCLLHARGGVSVLEFFIHATGLSSPRSWRCFPCVSTHTQHIVVFSTLVEVFLD